MGIMINCQAKRYENDELPSYTQTSGADILVSTGTLVNIKHSRPNVIGSVTEHHMRYLCPECEVVELTYLSDSSFKKLKAAGLPEEQIEVKADFLDHPECKVIGPMGEADAVILKLDLSNLPTFHRSEEPGTA